MSRIGKKPVKIIAKTEVTISENQVLVKGPLGQLTMDYLPVVEITKEEDNIVVKPKNQEAHTLVLWGTYTSIIDNMITGVNKAYEKNLIIEGVGYKIDVQGKNAVLKIGFSHPVTVPIPEGIKMTVEKEKISISGIDKQVVGHFAAYIRSLKKPEPYKGKGIRYSTEVIRRKEGKKNV